MDKKYDQYDLEDFILDQDFFRLAKAKYRGSDNNSWDLLLQEYPENKIIIEKAYRIINGLRIEELQVSDEKIQQDFLFLKKKIRQRQNRKLLYWVSSAAACFILVLSGLYFFDSSQGEIVDKNTMLTQLATADTGSEDIQIIFGESKNSISDNNATIREEEDGTLLINDKPVQAQQKESDYIQLIVPKGKRSFVTLKDGSKIWVNSGTKLLYPSQLDNKKREIYVDGEIYLEVAKDPSRPFLVHTANLDVKVLGTSFNISAYADDLFTEVVLVTGSVEVNTNAKEITRLVPNTCYHLEDDTGVIRQIDVYKYICWKDGIMKLEGEELKEVFKRLSRYYNIDIISSPDIDKVRYFGKLGLEDTLETVLYNISLVEPISFDREGDTIRIRRSPNNN